MTPFTDMMTIITCYHYYCYYNCYNYVTVNSNNLSSNASVGHASHTHPLSVKFLSVAYVIRGRVGIDETHWGAQAEDLTPPIPLLKEQVLKKHLIVFYLLGQCGGGDD